MSRRKRGAVKETSSADPAEAPSFDRRDLAFGGLIALGAMAVYVATLCPTIYVEDSAEFSAAAAELGVPHPPGYPLYTLVAAAFVRLFPIGDIGYRSNLFSAVCGAAAVGVLWILLRRSTISRAAALAATFCFAFGATFWSQCLAAEVHALNGLLLALALLGAFEAIRAASKRTFAAAGLAIGLAIGHRNLNVLFLAPLLVLLWNASRTVARRYQVLLSALAAMAASAIVYIYLPIAARRDPALDMGAPVTFARFYSVISAHAYLRHVGAGTAATDFGRLGRFLVRLPADLGLALFALPVGLIAWWRRRELAWLAVVAWMALACVFFAALYNVPDVESYLIPAHLALAVGAAVGFQAWRGKSRVLLPLVALVALPMIWPAVTLRHTTIARDYGRQLLASAPPRAMIISFADTETHVLDYEQGVQHERGDVVVVSANEIDGWYVEQLVRRHPDIPWPAADAGDGWLASLLARVGTSRPICLTQPVGIGGDGARLVPTGLLYCLAPRMEARDLDRSVAFWQTAVTPSSAELAQNDVHVQMVDFSFALSRFMLASALAEIGDVEKARAQLGAVVAANPDVSERAIVTSMRTIGREDHRDLSLGRRSQAALLLDARDPRFLQLLRL